MKYKRDFQIATEKLEKQELEEKFHVSLSDCRGQG